MNADQTHRTNLTQQTAGSLWFDESVEPEELIRRDPCEEDEDLLKLAGFITFLDALVDRLPDKESTIREEELWLKSLPRKDGGRETVESFLQRLGA